MMIKQEQLAEGNIVMEEEAKASKVLDTRVVFRLSLHIEGCHFPSGVIA